MAQTGNTKNTPQGEAASEESQERPETPAAGDDPLRKFSALSGDWFWVQDAQLRLTYMSSRLGESSGIDLALYLGARTAHDLTALVTGRYRRADVRVFYLDPNEYEPIESNTRVAGANVRYEVGDGVRAVERINAHPKPRAVLRIGFEKRAHHFARLWLFRLGDGVFEIDQHDVGGARGRLFHFAVAVARREQPGACVQTFHCPQP